MIMKWIKIIVIVLAAVLAYYVVNMLTAERKEREYKTKTARIKSIEQMVELCTLDVHEEVPLKDSVNGKWIVARQTIEGRVRFDLDSLKVEERGDTTIVYLPPERVDVMESASPSAYEIYDSWDASNRLFGRALTAAEENTLKRRWQKNVVKRVYDRGYVSRARRQAVESLTPLFRQMQGPFGKEGPVIVIDPTPSGTRR